MARRPASTQRDRRERASAFSRGRVANAVGQCDVSGLGVSISAPRCQIVSYRAEPEVEREMESGRRRSSAQPSETRCGEQEQFTSPCRFRYLKK